MSSLASVGAKWFSCGMCKKVICPTCSKPGWAGCGAHIEEVLGDIPVSERCHCNDEPAPQKSGLSSLFRRKG